MKAEANRKSFYQGAMQQGTMLGIVWSIMFLLLFIGTDDLLMLFTSMTLFMGSPVIAALLAIKYRRTECNNTMSYMQAWGFTFYMYIFASIFCAFITFLYFKFVDGGAFFQSIQKMLTESMNTPGLPEAMKQQFQMTMEEFSRTTPIGFTWTILNSCISNSCFLPFLIAIFVRKNNK